MFPKTTKYRHLYQAPGLEIQIGETQIIIPLHETECPSGEIFRFADGSIQVSEIKSGIGMRTSNGGRTWRKEKALFGHGAYQFADGEIVQFADPLEKGLKRTDKEGVFSILFKRSADNGHTTKKETATVNILEAVDAWPMVIVELRDGSLLASMQGHFKTDTLPAFEGIDTEGKHFHTKGRAFVVRSNDRGKTWDYLSTIAFDLTKGDKLLAGFVEPGLLTLPDGNILCFMRTGGEYYGRCTYTPLHMSQSNDGGKSWSNAYPVADRGIYPNSCLMRNGVIAVASGRPGNWLMFSLDNGETWVGHHCFYLGPNSFDCANHITLEEVTPNTLLVVYGRTDPNDCMKSEILGTYITVKRKGDNQ